MAAKAAIHDKPRQTRFWVRLRVCKCKSWMAAFAAMTRRSTLFHRSLAT